MTSDLQDKVSLTSEENFCEQGLQVHGMNVLQEGLWKLMRLPRWLPSGDQGDCPSCPHLTITGLVMLSRA